MLDKETLDAIKPQTKSNAPKAKGITMTVFDGFAHGKVVISSNDKQFIYNLSNQLEWIYKGGDDIYETFCQFKDGKNAIAVGNVIKDDLSSKGWNVTHEIKACR